MTNYVLDGLIKRRAWSAGEIENTRGKLRQLVIDLEALDATIMQFDPDFQVEAIKPKLEQLQIDLDEWIDTYNNERTHQGKVCGGRTPLQTLEDGKAIWKEKFVDQT